MTTKQAKAHDLTTARARVKTVTDWITATRPDARPPVATAIEAAVGILAAPPHQRDVSAHVSLATVYRVNGHMVAVYRDDDRGGPVSYAECSCGSETVCEHLLVALATGEGHGMSAAATERTYRVTILRHPSGDPLEDIDFTGRPDRAKDIDTLPRFQVPGSYEIAICTVDSHPSGGSLIARVDGYLKHVDEPDQQLLRCRYATGRTANMRRFGIICVPHDTPVYDRVMIDRKVLRILWAIACESGVKAHSDALDRVESHVSHALGTSLAVDEVI